MDTTLIIGLVSLVLANQASNKSETKTAASFYIASALNTIAFIIEKVTQ